MLVDQNPEKPSEHPGINRFSFKIDSLLSQVLRFIQRKLALCF